ncbi:hypothetical protein OH76DRAFT_27407 [Lentinus brumalis]|uniref:Uncharacterized protein n=1 Tax=Lentinus brumalis TaxID=2498619 RepID=A0A371DXJ0_9APHY|nr:hypothetical protein OH76DRAFT_27407 [Polyporus brumalis]
MAWHGVHQPNRGYLLGLSSGGRPNLGNRVLFTEFSFVCERTSCRNNDFHTCSGQWLRGQLAGSALALEFKGMPIHIPSCARRSSGPHRSAGRRPPRGSCDALQDVQELARCVSVSKCVVGLSVESLLASVLRKRYSRLRSGQRSVCYADPFGSS